MINQVTKLLAIFVVAAWASSSNALPIVAGTIINFDIGPLGGLDNDGGLPQTSYSTVDFDGDGNPDVWNRMGQTPGSTVFGGIQDIVGNELDATVTLRADGVQNRDGNTNNNAWSNAQGVPTEVMNSWYFKGTGEMSLSIVGLNSSLRYTVEIFNAFGAWAGQGNLSDMKVNGLFADGTSTSIIASAGNDWNRYTNGFVPRTGLKFSNVSADSGTLLATFSGGNPTVQAIRITAVPAPATLALFGLGLLGLGWKRRK
ncbi:PEP-CTERM sorting domain-containing protein [Congregibacter sp.]|uniref:PEP-CTERM sorting domain-containing protein n=1 Tax=Congregibacter sp. TaxID=2744308 RepID=UPI0039E22903